jgi:small subunit ribosomal protein S6
MRRYETIFILRPDLGEAAQKETIKRFEGIIASSSGDLVETDEWGFRELAYNIKGERRGYYVRLDYGGAGATLNEVERNLKLADGVLRHLSVLVEDDADLEKARAEVEARKRRTAEARAAAEARIAAAATAAAERASQTAANAAASAAAHAAASGAAASAAASAAESAAASPAESAPAVAVEAAASPEAAPPIVSPEEPTPTDDAVEAAPAAHDAGGAGESEAEAAAAEPGDGKGSSGSEGGGSEGGSEN